MSVLPWVGLITGCLALLLTAARPRHTYTFSAPKPPCTTQRPTPHSQHYKSITCAWQSHAPIAVEGYPPDACPLCGTA